MEKYICIVLSLTFNPLYSLASSEYDVDTFCQDMNVILQKVRVHSFNISNHRTTRTAEGGPFKKRIVSDCSEGICKVTKDETPPILEYAPDHPDADKNGYVAYPNFSIHEEKGKLIKAENAYNVVVLNMPVKSVDLLVGNKFADCHKNYKFFKEQFDFQAYLGR